MRKFSSGTTVLPAFIAGIAILFGASTGGACIGLLAGCLGCCFGCLGCLGCTGCIGFSVEFVYCGT